MKRATSAVYPGGTRKLIVLRTVLSPASVGLFCWIFWDFAKVFGYSDCGFL